MTCIPLIMRLEPDIQYGYDSDFAADLIKVTQYFANNTITTLRNNVSDITLEEDRFNVVFYTNYHNYIKIVENQLDSGLWDEKILKFTEEGTLIAIK